MSSKPRAGVVQNSATRLGGGLGLIALGLVIGYFVPLLLWFACALGALFIASGVWALASNIDLMARNSVTRTEIAIAQRDGASH